jgi:hypothetical protein
MEGNAMSTDTDTTYNGWTNYETWSLALWLGNDQGSYLYWQEVAEDTYRNAEANRSFTRRQRATLAFADQLKDETEENAPELGASFYADMLSAALSEINWHEIAKVGGFPPSPRSLQRL